MRGSMESRVEGLIKQLQGVTDKSVCVGFGVSRPEQVRAQRQALWLRSPPVEAAVSRTC